MTDCPDTETIKALLAVATPGPWTCEPHGNTMALYAGRSGTMHGLRLLNLDDGDWNFHANASLIARAPDLAARVIELEAENARLRDAINEATDPDFIWGAMDNVFDMDSELDDLAAAASRAIRAALGDRT